MNGPFYFLVKTLFILMNWHLSTPFKNQCLLLEFIRKKGCRNRICGFAFSLKILDMQILEMIDIVIKYASLMLKLFKNNKNAFELKKYLEFRKEISSRNCDELHSRPYTKYVVKFVS